jgi:hypothetical protein
MERTKSEMSISQPSREVYVIDVPEIKVFEAIYHYNFFVPDESVNETGGVPSHVLSRPGAEVDSHFVQYSITRVPRFVEFRWTKPKLADIGNLLSEQAHRENSFRTTGEQNGSLILSNIDKVVNEDDFASNHYSSVHFHDGEIDKKIHDLVSGSMVQQTLEEEHDHNNSHYKAAQRFVPLLPSHIRPHFIFQALTFPYYAYGAQFYAPSAASAGFGVRGGFFNRLYGARVLYSYFQRLRHVTVNTQINTKLMHDLVNKAIKDPTSPHASDLVNMHHYSKQAKHATNQRFTPAVSEQDFKTFVPFVHVRQHGTSAHIEKYGSEIVGYIIDKFEVLTDGTTRAHPPIVIDSAHANITADFQVKFNANYCYTIRTIALLTMPAIDDDSGQVATIKVLVSSKPSNKVYVSTLKLDAPPPPGDINFVWNYETNPDTNKPFGLVVDWAFPVTSERDVKQFQVFRREKVDHCFELQKAYIFDDSVVPFPSAETPDAALVERLTSPVAFWPDNEFDWEINNTRDKGLIYAICAVDAHGLTSNYSAQYRVWFDRFKNKLQKELVSHAGAPKPYPNMYLEANLFQNTIRVAGPHSKRMKVYFNPEYYYLYDDHQRYVKVLQTKQTGGAYKLQFLNIDNLKTHDLDIVIDDNTLMTSRRLAYPTIRFGPKRRVLQSQA